MGLEMWGFTGEEVRGAGGQPAPDARRLGRKAAAQCWDRLSQARGHPGVQVIHGGMGCVTVPVGSSPG